MSLKIQFDENDLRPLLKLAVGEALDRMEGERIDQLPEARRRHLLGQVGRVLGRGSYNR